VVEVVAVREARGDGGDRGINGEQLSASSGLLSAGSFQNSAQHSEKVEGF